MNRYRNFHSILKYTKIRTLHRQNTFPLKTHPESKLCRSIKDRIIYSSYLENQKLKLDYKRNKILQQVFENAKKANRYQDLEAKTFPTSLKAFSNDVQITYPHKDDTTEGEKEIMVKAPKICENWMQDYEFYDKDSQDSTNGTPDPSITPSKVPCSGCGAVLHCADTGLPGYIPSEIFNGRTDSELKTIICQRCHFLKNYNIALDIAIIPEKYVEILSSIKEKYALIILIVDLLDFPCSIWPGITDIIGRKRPVFIVGNKVDLLPKDSSGYLNHIKECLTTTALDFGLSNVNIKNVALISAKTGYGIEELITKLHKIWRYEGNVYLVGCANVGKSSLFNALLRSDYCKVSASDLIQKATACPWPGTTLQMLKFPILRPSDIRLFYRTKRLISERNQKQAEERLRRDQLKSTHKSEYATLIGHIGQTFRTYDDNLDPFNSSQVNNILHLNENHKDYVNSKWCYDTPGVIQQEQILNMMTIEEIMDVIPSKMITPRSFLIKTGMALFVSGLGRICFLSGEINSVRITVYAASKIPILITSIKDAEEIYRKLLGSDFLGVPRSSETLKNWPELEPSGPIDLIGIKDDCSSYDIVLSSIGWVGLNIPKGKRCTFLAWTPQKRGIFVRKPSLIPYGERLRGKRIRGSLAYRKKI